MLKALIVEDHAVFRQSLNQILSDRFPTMQLEQAENGKAALQRFNEQLPDLVFMDIQLPDENGFNLTRLFKARQSHTTVIILTSYDLPEYRIAAIEAGASYFFPKGSLGKDMFDLIESVIASSSSQNPHRNSPS